MNVRSWVVASVVAFGIVACNPGKNPPAQDSAGVSTVEADSAAIAQITRELDEAYSSENFQAAARHFSEDIVHLPPNEPPVVGRAAVSARDSVFGATYDDTLSSAIEDVKVSGSHAVVRLTYTESWARRDAGERVTVEGKTLLVLRKAPTGTWQITHYMWNGNAPRK